MCHCVCQNSFAVSVTLHQKCLFLIILLALLMEEFKFERFQVRMRIRIEVRKSISSNSFCYASFVKQFWTLLLKHSRPVFSRVATYHLHIFGSSVATYNLQKHFLHCIAYAYDSFKYLPVQLLLILAW